MIAICRECGMATAPREYHPYAACLMFKACRSAATVRSNMEAVLETGRAQGRAQARKNR